MLHIHNTCFYNIRYRVYYLFLNYFYFKKKIFHKKIAFSMKNTSYQYNQVSSSETSLVKDGVLEKENHTDKSNEIPFHIRSFQFLLSLIGIYFCYLYYGILQEYMYFHKKL